MFLLLCRMPNQSSEYCFDDDQVDPSSACRIAMISFCECGYNVILCFLFRCYNAFSFSSLYYYLYFYLFSGFIFNSHLSAFHFEMLSLFDERVFC